MGRPTKFTSELAAAICERLAAGESLRSICRDEGMPQWQTIYRWMGVDVELSNRIAHAREIGADAIAEQALEIADTPMAGVREEESDEGFKRVTEDMLGHRKLQVDTRLKLLAKWFPKKYGDNSHLQLTGPDDGPVLVEHKATTLAAILSTAAARKAKEDADLEGLV